METNSTNKCCTECSSYPMKEDANKDYTRLICVIPECSCHHPVTQSKEWDGRFDVSFLGLIDEYEGLSAVDYKKIKDFISYTLRTELESLLQEIDDDCKIECRGHDFEGRTVKMSHCHECGVRTMREVISKRIKEI